MVIRKIGLKSRLTAFFSSRPVHVISRFVLGSIFIYAALDKIAHPLEFSKIIYNYRLLPDILINFVAVCLPWLELITGLFLILGMFVQGASIILTSLLLVFVLALGINAIRGIAGNCGCFTVVELKNDNLTSHSGGLFLLLRDIIFLIPGIILIFFEKKKN